MELETQPYGKKSYLAFSTFLCNYCYQVFQQYNHFASLLLSCFLLKRKSYKPFTGGRLKARFPIWFTHLLIIIQIPQTNHKYNSSAVEVNKEIFVPPFPESYTEVGVKYLHKLLRFRLPQKDLVQGSHQPKM